MTTGVEIPQRVRLATLFTWLLAPAGLLLALDGLWELRWWASPSAHHLTAVLTQIENEFGVQPPELLRGHAGAIELVVLGVLTMAAGFFARGIRRGDRTARMWVFTLGILALVAGVIFIGSDASQPIDIGAYLGNMHQGIATERIPEVEAALYPGWYSWVEDLVQGLAALIAALAVGSLAVATIWHGDWFVGLGAEATSAPEADAWDDAITRIHQRTVGKREES